MSCNHLNNGIKVFLENKNHAISFVNRLFKIFSYLGSPQNEIYFGLVLILFFYYSLYRGLRLSDTSGKR